MEDDFEDITNVRLLAQQALIQVIFRSWGEPLCAVVSNARRTHEAMKASALQQDMTDEQIEWIDREFNLALKALDAQCRSLPDTRPHPI